VRARVGGGGFGSGMEGNGDSDSGVFGVCGYQKIGKSDYSCVRFLGYNIPVR